MSDGMNVDVLVGKVKEILDARKGKGLLTTRDMVKTLGRSPSSLFRVAKDPLLYDYRWEHNKSKVMWGHPDDVKARYAEGNIVPSYTAPKKEEPVGTRAEYLESALKDATRELKLVRTKLAKEEEFYRVVAEQVTHVSPVTIQKPTKATKKNPEIAAVLMLSDWHIGEIIKAGEVEGMNEFNYAIAVERMTTITQNFLKWVDNQRSAYTINKVYIITNGDLISGGIHHELDVSAEFPIPTQVYKAAELLISVYQTMCENFPEVHACQVSGGNHGRLTVKPQFKGRAENNYEALVHLTANHAMLNQKNFITHTTEGFVCDFDIMGKNVLVTHGSDIKGVLGIPFYGFARYAGRTAEKRMRTHGNFASKPVDVFCVAHFHQFCILGDGNFLVNRSLCGSSELDAASQRYAEPGQVAFFMGNHGPFNVTPFGVD